MSGHLSWPTAWLAWLQTEVVYPPEDTILIAPGAHKGKRCNKVQ